MRSVGYPLPLQFYKYAGPNPDFHINVAHTPTPRGMFPMAMLGAAGVGAGALYGYNKYQDYAKAQEEKRKAAEAAQNPLSGLDAFISPDRQGATGIGALLGAGIGGYMGYNRDQDPRSALMGALAGAGLGGGAGYLAAPYFKKQETDVNDTAQQMQDAQKAATAQLYIGQFIKNARKHTPIVSEQQRKFFGAVASGKAKAPGLSKAEAGRHLAESKGKNLPKWHNSKAAEAQYYLNELMKTAGSVEGDMGAPMPGVQPNERSLSLNAGVGAGIGGLAAIPGAHMMYRTYPQEGSLHARMRWALSPAKRFSRDWVNKNLIPGKMTTGRIPILNAVGRYAPMTGIGLGVGALAGAGIYGAKRLYDYATAPESAKSASASFFNNLVKFADGADEGDSKLRDELTDADKTAIHEFIRDNPGLVDANFHAFVEARGIRPSAAETYTYNLLQRMLEEESTEQKEAAGSNFLRGILKTASLPPDEEPSIAVQALDMMSRHPYLTTAAAMVPGAIVGSMVGRGMSGPTLAAMDWVNNYYGRQIFQDAGPTLAAMGGAIGALPAGYMAARFSRYALNNPNVNLDLTNGLYDRQPKGIPDYVQ